MDIIRVFTLITGRLAIVSIPSLCASPSDVVGTLYVDHGGWLHQWLSRRFGNSFNAADVADLTHDTFVRLLLKPREFNGSSDARAFLCTVARGLCIDQWRRQRIERAWLETLAAQPTFVEPSLEYRALVIEALEQIDRMLQSLPGKARQAFLLAQLYGLGYREIAAEVGVSERMVKKYMAQAMYQCLLLEASQ